MKYLTSEHQLPDDLIAASRRKKMSPSKAEKYFTELRRIVRQIRDARQRYEQNTGQIIQPEPPPEE